MNINEKMGISVGTEETIDFIKDIVKECLLAIERLKGTNIFEPEFVLRDKLSDILIAKNQINTDKFIQYGFLVGLPCIKNTIKWLSEDTILNIICKKFKNVNDLQENLKRSGLPSAVSSYLIDDITLINYCKSNKYGFLYDYIKRQKSIKYSQNVDSSLYKGSKLPIGLINLNFSFVAPRRNIYFGNILIQDFSHFNILDSYLQHELNHIHKSEQVTDDNYLEAYEKFIDLLIENNNEIVKDFVKNAYYAIPNEVNAFVEQCFKEYQNLIDKNTNFNAVEKTDNGFISDDLRLNMIKATKTYKRLLNSKNYFLKNQEIFLSDKIVELLYKKLNDIVPSIFNVKQNLSETNRSFIKRTINAILTNLNKGLLKCERSRKVLESYRLCGFYNICASREYW